MEHLDSSIPTMEKILSILQDAETNIEKTDQHVSNEGVLQGTVTAATKESHALLGVKALDYHIFRLLNDAGIVSKYTVFENIKPETCDYILKQHAEILREKFLWLNNALASSDIGEKFLQNPAHLHSELRPLLSQRLSQMLIDFNRVKKTPNLVLDFTNIRTPNPFRGRIDHPMMMRKGLNFEKTPLNLFCFIVDDHDVLSAFLGKLKSHLHPGLLLNLMKSQALEGNSAFKLLMTKHLKDDEAQFRLRHPIDSFGQTSIHELDSDLSVVKAIVAHKSRLLSRLDSLGIYTDSFAQLATSKIKDNEDIVNILASAFDRYFGACYRLDAKYCDNWVAGLLDFYLENWDEKWIFEKHFEQCITEFRDKLTQATLHRLLKTWAGKQGKNKGKHKPSVDQSLVSS